MSREIRRGVMYYFSTQLIFSNLALYTPRFGD